MNCSKDSNPPTRAYLLLIIFFLWGFFAQSVASMSDKSPTVDEQAHLTRGYLYLELGNKRFRNGHPLLANAMNALPLSLLVNPNLPIGSKAWMVERWGLFSDTFIWESNNDVKHLFFLSRWMTVALGTVFAALTYRWSRQLWGQWGGALSLILFTCDPNVVAHSRLVTNDIAVSFFYFAASYGLWRYLRTNQFSILSLTGILFGLAQGCKLSALLLGPVFIGVVTFWIFSHRLKNTKNRFHKELCRYLDLLLIFFMGGLTLWGFYGFDIGTLPGQRFSIPAPAYLAEIITRWHEDVKLNRYYFLCGQYSSRSWWYYFPLAFILKSPLPTILLLGTTLIVAARDQYVKILNHVPLILPPLTYLIVTLLSPLNIGYRHFIPVLPYLYVGIGYLGNVLKRPRIRRFLLIGTAFWSGIIVIGIHPHYLSYFNILAGGPDNGWRYLTDSNIDWGQDLPALRDLVQKQNLGRIKLAYFGTAHPSYYDIDFEPLPTWEPAPEQGNPFTKTYYPHQPAPGVYAISATLLQGVVMEPEQWDTYAWFRDKEPFAKAGYSIFLYRVEPTGPPADVALSGIQIDQLTPETFASFNTNDMRLRWFDAQTSFVIPDRPAWYVTSEANLASQGLEDTQNCTLDENVPCTLYPPDPEAHSAILKHIETTMADSETWFSSALVPSSEEQLSPLSLPANLDDQFRFLGYELEACNLKLTDCNLSTAWRVTAPPDGPRAIFVHLLAPDGEVAAQWDGLDVPVKGWRVGDTILQKASFDLPSDLGPGQYWLQTGVYNPDTMKRLPMLTDGEPIANRVLLSPVEVDDQ